MINLSSAVSAAILTLIDQVGNVKDNVEVIAVSIATCPRTQHDPDLQHPKVFSWPHRVSLPPN
jgi:hypothetical protein